MLQSGEELVAALKLAPVLPLTSMPYNVTGQLLDAGERPVTPLHQYIKITTVLVMKNPQGVENVHTLCCG